VISIKVSVIIPVYNGEKYLKKCLDSVVNQTYDNIEIIIINDGSIDNSLNIIKSYSKKDKRIKLIDKINEGQAKARNIALENVTGDYCLFVDSDDYIELNMISDLLEVANTNNSDIVSSDLMRIYENGSKSVMIGFQKITDDNNINFMLSDPGPCAKLFKTKFLKEQNFTFLEKRIYEDLAIIPSLAINARQIDYINNAYYNYIIHKNSTMNQTSFNKKLNDIFYSLENLKNNFDSKYIEELEYIYIKYLLHDASLRFLNFNCKESKQSLNKIINIMHKEYPNWKNNKYLYLMNKKELILTKIIYNKLYFIYNIYRKVVKL